MLVPLQCRRRVLQLEGAGLPVPLQAAAAGCCFRVLLLEWCVRCGAGLPVLLQDDAVAGWRCWLLLQNASSGCCCQSAVCALGVAAGSGCEISMAGP